MNLLSLIRVGIRSFPQEEDKSYVQRLNRLNTNTGNELTDADSGVSLAAKCKEKECGVNWKSRPGP